MSTIANLPTIKIIFLILTIGLALGCDPGIKKNGEKDLYEIQTFIHLMEYEMDELEEVIVSLGRFAESLFEKKDSLLKLAEEHPYALEIGWSNSLPDADMDYSTIYISSLVDDMDKVRELALITNPLDSAFREVVRQYGVVTQVYANSNTQLSRLYPPYDGPGVLAPDLDIEIFNFYYLANESYNPERTIVWVDEIYIDPVGRGWIASLLFPVYHQDELQFVLGFDITVNDIIRNYLNKNTKELVILDQFGTLVAGKNRGIELLSLPPIKNHTYIQTITSDSYRKEDFNVFRSKNQSVRDMAEKILLENETECSFESTDGKVTVYARGMSKLNWFVIDPRK